MRTISSKLILLLVFAALIPLLTFGLLSLSTSRKTAVRLVTERNLKVAERAAEEISQYVAHSARILQALASNINQTQLRPWQKEAIVREHVLQFKEFRTIHLVDTQGKLIATSSIRREPSLPTDEGFQRALRQGTPYRSEVFITDELIPTISLGSPVE